MTKNAILFSKKDYSLADGIRYVCRENKVNLTYCLNFPEVLHNIIDSNPEILFFDLENIKFPVSTYNDFINTKLFYMPKIVLLSPNPEKDIEYEGANIAVVDKRNFTEKIVEIMSSVEEKSAKPLPSERIEEIKDKTTKMLSDLGITTKYLGYEYIRELVIDIISDKRMLQSFNKKLYPKIAMKYNTQVNNVERNIRNAITIASRRNKNKILFDEISGRGVLCGAGPIPSNKQFITWLVDKVC